MRYVIEKRESGIVTHSNVNVDNLITSDEIEEFEIKKDFEDRLSELIDDAQ